MKKFILMTCVLLVMVNVLNAQQNDFPKLTGPYLGQKPPGMTPELFAPGIISRGYYERHLVFSPNHDELFFQLRCRGFTTVLLHMKQKMGTWSRPETGAVISTGFRPRSLKI